MPYNEESLNRLGERESMAKKNPEHFRAEFEFHEGKVFITCSCGNFGSEPTFPEAVTWLQQHHANVFLASGSVRTIYKSREA